MSTSAPNTRIVDQLTGNVSEPPSKFFKALSEADHFIAELDGVHELRTRVAELEGERDNLISDLADLREAHAVTVATLARCRRQGW